MFAASVGAMRGLYRYKIGEKWWVCAEEGDGQKVSIVRERYEMKELQPPFEELPLDEPKPDA
jgi:hypothetical protein